MDPSQLPAYLKAIRDQGATAAAPVANAMAETYRDYVRDVTLRESGQHPPFTRTTAAPGRPPMWISGRLAASVIARPAVSAGLKATSSVAPLAIYAGVQEYGREIFARRARYMRWYMEGDWWYARRVYVPPRPYLHPAREAVIHRGLLRASAAGAFWRHVAPVI